jgi:hypothetical protein
MSVECRMRVGRHMKVDESVAGRSFGWLVQNGARTFRSLGGRASGNREKRWRLREFEFSGSEVRVRNGLVTLPLIPKHGRYQRKVKTAGRTHRRTLHL